MARLYVIDVCCKPTGFMLLSGALMPTRSVASDVCAAACGVACGVVWAAAGPLGAAVLAGGAAGVAVHAVTTRVNPINDTIDVNERRAHIGLPPSRNNTELSVTSLEN